MQQECASAFCSVLKGAGVAGAGRANVSLVAVFAALSCVLYRTSITDLRYWCADDPAVQRSASSVCSMFHAIREDYVAFQRRLAARLHSDSTQCICTWYQYRRALFALGGAIGVRTIPLCNGVRRAFVRCFMPSARNTLPSARNTLPFDVSGLGLGLGLGLGSDSTQRGGRNACTRFINRYPKCTTF